MAGIILLPALAGANEATGLPENQVLRQDAERELRENILPWWLKNARDPARGGFHSFIGEDMVVRDDQPRGALLTARVLWTFSAAYRKFKNPEYLEMARWAYRDLTEHFVDRAHGGLFWSVTPDGRPLGTHKLVYGEVFGIYSLAEYFRATGDQAALEQAIAIYRLVDTRARDAKNGGYTDMLTREWQPEKKLDLNPLGAAPKSQNSHIHILEAFTNLLRVWPDPGLKQRHRELIDLMFAHIIDPRTHHLILFMRDDWTPIGHDVSYGHDIELSWLLVEAAEIQGDPELVARSQKEAVAIARVTDAEGIDRDGGVFTEGDERGPTKKTKEWWEQAEAVVGFLNAGEISHDPQFFRAAQRSWKFIQEKFVDRKHGDWHNTLRRDGEPLPGAKASIWKCPYHNGRACLEVIGRLEAN